MTLAASLARGTPVALETKGTVREARGLTSRIKTTSLRMANWMFINPLTLSSRANAYVFCLMTSINSSVSV